MYPLTQNESHIGYYVRLMSLRQKTLTNREDSLYDANLFKNTIFTYSKTGIRNGNVRNYIHLLLKIFTITDEELLECVTFAVSNESEWPEKFSD